MPTIEMPSRPRPRRAALFGACSLCLCLSVLTPAPAHAKMQQPGRAGAHKRTVRNGCAAKRRNDRSRSARSALPKRGHGHQTCASRRSGKHNAGGSPHPGGSIRSLQATPLAVAGEQPPVAPAAEGSSHRPPGGKAGGGERPVAPEGNPPGRPGTTLPVESGEVVGDPIDSRFLTDVPFGSTSFWLQPWRAYLDTWPASRLLEAVGINFNVGPAQAEATAQLLHDSGFRLARIGIGWAALSYKDPTTFLAYHLAAITARLTALHNHGLRPLIVLDAYSAAPTPEKGVNLETISAAPAGAQTVQLTAASAAQVVPGKTGFNDLAFKGAPDILVTSVADGVATLSRPLLKPLAAGRHGGTTLLYAPFGPPKLASGEPNPEFQATLAGWLNYVEAVSKLAAQVVGPGGFDLEIWNELTWGSQFLNAENYYATPSPGAAAHLSSAAGSRTPSLIGQASPAPEPEQGAESNYSSEPGQHEESDYGSETESSREAEEGPEEGVEEATGEEEGTEAPQGGLATATRQAISRKHQVGREIRKALLDATVGYVRNAANGISPAVGITNGFASQTPFPSGAAAPAGLTALSKHPYVNARSFPTGYVERANVPKNALGERDAARASFKPLFIPTYQSLFPEYTLTGTSTETLIRDIAPFTTHVYHFPHGRNVGPAGGAPVQKWITEYNLGVGGATVVGPDEVTPQTGGSATLTAADREHFHAKALLRSLVAMIGKGISREYFFGAAPGAFSLIGERFYSALEEHPGDYPGDQLGGETMGAFHNLLSRFQGPGPPAAPTQLKLVSVAQDGNHAQFAGDGSFAHPPLYDRDMLALLPFQSSATHFVIPFYVMTLDMLTLYDPGAPSSDRTRFDLPNETFTVTLANLPETARPPTVGAYDPLHDTSTSARLVSREGSTAVLELAASDYPRLLTLDYSGS
jgi:hypothetical protein